MSWANLDDGYADHPKILGLSDAAFRLHTCALCWCSRRGTDGAVVPRDLKTLGSMIQSQVEPARLIADELVPAKLWDPVDGGWQIHNWKKRNKPAAKIEEEREASRARIAAWREARKAEKAAERLAAAGQQDGNASAYGVHTPSDPIPSDPIPSDPIPSDPIPSDPMEDLRSSFAGGSSPTRPVVETGQTSEPQSPRTPAPVQGSRPEQDGLPGLVLAATQKPSRNAPKASKEPSATAETWDAYSSAYKQRYGNPPARNAKINGQLAQLVAQLGADEAPIVAAFYLTHPAAIYNFHPVGLLLRDCQALRTQWMRGSVVTPTAARRNEETAANPALALLLEQRRKKNGNG